jgi:hypothetical protein
MLGVYKHAREQNVEIVAMGDTFVWKDKYQFDCPDQ